MLPEYRELNLVLCENLEGGMGWCVGGGSRREGHTYTYNTYMQIHVVWQKSAQGCKESILQLKVNEIIINYIKKNVDVLIHINISVSIYNGT